MKVHEIAQRVGGSVIGNLELEILGVCSVDEARQGFITFLESKKYINQFQNGSASAVLIAEEIETDKVQIITSSPKLAFAKLLAEFYPPTRPKPNIDAKAAVGKNVKLGKDVTLSEFVSVADNVSIGDNTILFPGVSVGSGSQIGKDCILYPNVTLYPETEIGDRVSLHAGSVIGADGFGYAPDEKGRHFKIQQIGRVVIENDVEVGANTCIDRAAIGETRIRQGTKIDNLVQIAHNCSIGEHSVIVSQVGISGSCILGRNVVLAGQVGIGDHVTLGDQVTLAAQSGTFRDIDSKEVHGGSPSVPLNTWKKYVIHLPKLPDYARKIKEMEKRIVAIENDNPRD